MNKLTRELTEQALLHPNGLECQGEGVDKTFIIVDAEVMRQMKETIERGDLRSVQAGIHDMEAGRMQSSQEAYLQGREQLSAQFKS